MNITDLITSQLSGDVLGKLGGLIGTNEQQTRSATTAAVPALLRVFSKLASTNSGADQLAKAMGGLDLGMLGNLAGALGGSQASGLGNLGGGLLGTLLGNANTLSSIVNALSSFAGMQPGIMKTLLGYLAPIVLGVVAKQLGGRPDASSVSRLFSEQAGNIASALPKGLSLGDFASAAVSSASRATQPSGGHGHRHEPAQSGMPGWLLPLLALAALGVGWYLWNQNKMKQAGEVVVGQVKEKVGPVTETVTDVVATKGKEAAELLTDVISIDPKFLEAGKVAGGLFTGLTKVLGGVRDEASAKAAIPELEKFAPMLTTLEEEAGKLPADEKPAFSEVIGKNLGLLQKLIDTAMGFPGVKDLLGPVVGPMIEALTKMSK
jgi:hypothetical protein